MKLSVVCFLGVILSLPSLGATFDGLHVSGGPKLQKTWRMYWENGVQVEIGHDALLANRLRVGASYISTRLGSAWASEAFKQDSYLASASYHFLPGCRADPHLKLNWGWFAFDTEFSQFEALDSDAFLLSISPGIDVFLHPKAGWLRFGFGYQVFQDADMVFPLFFDFSLVLPIIPGWFS